MFMIFLWFGHIWYAMFAYHVCLCSNIVDRHRFLQTKNTLSKCIILEEKGYIKD